MRLRLWILVGLIFVLTVGAVIVDIPNDFWITTKVHLGLDLQGGSHLVYSTDLADIADEDKNDAVSSVIEVIRRRVDALGVAEPVIQSTKISGTDAVIVELPGILDINRAKEIVGKTAQLQFMEQSEETVNAETIDTSSSTIPGFKETGLNGSHLKKADVQFSGGTSSSSVGGSPEISLQFTGEGGDLFKEITTRNIGKPVAIVLDSQVISAPTVQTVIESGQAVITGQFTIEEAKDLAIQLNAGALPVPVELVEERTVGATLGDESIRLSFIAGIIGIILVIIFMILYYRYLGFVASLALVIYALVVLALFKLIPVTMTLAGVAGFILSIGMAVDANILIFERTKEELREGKDEVAAVNEGFSRAWTSIRDSNVSTIITCIILFWLGTGIVRGFALTLGLGVLISMFSAITITKSFLDISLLTKTGKGLVRFV